MAQTSSNDTAVVIPAFQAAKSISEVVRAVLALGLPVLVVDDASTDRTQEQAFCAGARVIRRNTNGGKGIALRQGLAAALEEGFTWVMAMDADGQHLPCEVARFLERRNSGADMVVGNRMEAPRGMPLDRWMTNRIMSWIISRISGQRIPDTQCGFRLISRRLLEKVPLTSDRFEIESEMVIRGALAGFKIESVPVSSIYRRQISFIRPVRDTFRFFRLLWLIQNTR